MAAARRERIIYMNSPAGQATGDGQRVTWEQSGESHTALWRSANGVPAPARIIVVNDELTADRAYRHVCEGTALLWQGDYHNARQMLQALARRIDKPPRPRRDAAKRADAAPPVDFNRHRMNEAQRARLLGLLLVAHDADHGVTLRRAPDVRLACLEALGPATQPYLASLRELLGMIGAHQWRRLGVEIPALGARIHPHYGVYSPVRGEYLDLVTQAPLPPAFNAGDDTTAFDIGTGTGVIAALLAHRGVTRIVASDNDERALACARDNVDRLGLSASVTVVQADLFPPGRAGLVVCNPPWIPGKAATLLERAVYDPGSRMLRGFLSGLEPHLAKDGEGWLILSDIAELLGLRTRDELLAWIAQANLVVLDRLDTKPRHARARDTNDPLHAVRSRETTSLWRLGVRR